MKIAVYSQYFDGKSTEYFEQLLEILLTKEVSVFIESEFRQKLDLPLLKDKRLQSFTSLDESFDLLISVGGDGTILRAVTFLRDFSIPIVGINTGRLGFLATIQVNHVELAINEILKGNYKISERSLLTVETNPKNMALQSINFALNEVAISRKNTTSMISVDTHLDGEYLTSYWSDGLIISTPTGSTGYSLSCGGPVITPDTESLVLTPIAPHNLNARPLVIPDATVIQLKVNGREDNYLISLDSRIATLSNDTIVTIKKANFKIKMLQVLEESFIDTLRKKLLWGEDRRN
ncbi:NAD kinase [Subsaximicrobium wynnwilliamsii]|uniref:NAD kinase n=1 Tax=Subsaximicrobium wynnwilliamsii TaxID=291179 RepID=A0A5C6ZDE5_9FLAO|nr:NAD kinase [Subsaximicrobium wynnwilliamsii]TXD82275.1 NAD kinase [Subsaximicrobium wynnwilliamsii]TXD87913.1 NAD kinase [Subsaximicrobium wynnwilliamsii]TXE01906.1 NAD kinase [Subsaximicrobium wynnwilliamsii]